MAMESYYKIAGLTLAVHTESPPLGDEFELFRTEAAPPDLSLTYHRGLTEADSELIYSDSGFSWRRTNDGGSYVTNGSEQELHSQMFVRGDYTRADIYIGGGGDGNRFHSSEIFGPLCEIAFRNLVLTRGGCLLHASACRYKGRGIVFSAPSGTGKTTQARLWQAAKGVEMINGDVPVILFGEDDAPRVHGSVWSGSDPVYTNASAEVAAIVFLRQHHENQLSRLSPEEVAGFLFPRTFMSFSDRHLMALGLAAMDKLIASTAMYLLRCTPDVRAVDLLYDELTERGLL
jgi:hypothetical protein